MRRLVHSAGDLVRQRPDRTSGGSSSNSSNNSRSRSRSRSRGRTSANLPLASAPRVVVARHHRRGSSTLKPWDDGGFSEHGGAHGGGFGGDDGVKGEANRRARDLRIRSWTPRRTSSTPPAGLVGDGGGRGGGAGDGAGIGTGGSGLMEAFCAEFARLAVELEEGWV